MTKLELFVLLNLHNLYAKLGKNLYERFYVNHDSFLRVDFGYSCNFLQYFKKAKT